MKENTTKDIDVYSKESTVIERPESYNIGVKVGWTAPAKWWNWLFNACTMRLKELFNTTTSIHNEIKNAVGGTLDPKSDTQLKDKLEQMKKDLTDMTAQVSANLAALEATKAKPNGIASLDPDGRIPYSQLPESAMEFKGNWNASTNTPALADGTGNLGDMYLVTAGGTVNLGSADIKFFHGDRVIYNQAGKWEKISGGSVKTVNRALPDISGDINVFIDTEHIKNGAVTTAKIEDGAVDRNQLGLSAVDTKNIASAAVTTAKIAIAAVTTAKIANGAVTTVKIEDGAVTGAKCQVGSYLYMHYITLKTDKIQAYFSLLTKDEKKIVDYEELRNNLRILYSSSNIPCSGIYSGPKTGEYGTIVTISGDYSKLYIQAIVGTASYSLSAPKESAVVSDNVFKIILG